MEVLAESQARRKLKEARYFLQQIRTCAECLDEEKFWYNLSAFVSAWTSVREYLLYDYAEKLGLGFTRDEYMREHDFEVAARAKNTTEARQFLDWWKRSRGKLDEKLQMRRKFLIHRGYQDDVSKEFVPVKEFSVPVSSGVSAYLTAPLAFGQGPESWAGSIPQPLAVAGTRIVDSKRIAVPILKLPDLRYEFRFADYPDVNAVDVCQRAYDQAEQIVDDAENEVWKQE